MLSKALIAVAALAIASPVQANAITDYLQSNPVLKEVHNSGTVIKFKDPSCNKNILGSYDMEKDDMVICVKNHVGFAQLADTIRHETINVIQMCMGGPVLPLSKLAKLAKPMDWAFVDGYDNHSHHHHELEARLGARELSDAQVVTNLKEACYDD